MPVLIGVYDDPTLSSTEKSYEGPAWANDLDTIERDAFIFDNSLRYAGESRRGATRLAVAVGRRRDECWKASFGDS
jgi:hypothetical protein